VLASACGGEPVPGNGAGLEQMVDSLLPRIEAVSGMRALGPVRIERRTTAEVLAYVERQVSEELPPPVLDGIARTYALLGLMPDTLDLRALLLELYTEQIVGYYDPQTDVLYVVDSVPVGSLLPVVTHELVHALQDQRADLEALIAPERGNDRQTAAQAALEGHATLVMFALLATDADGNPSDPLLLPNPAAQLRPALQSPQGQFPVFRRAPRIIQETMLFPYIGGSTFVQELWRSRSASAAGRTPPPLDSLLPLSTEQILHPHRAFLDARDEPTELRFAAAEGGVVYENTFGEFEMRLLFEQHLGARDPAPSDGWDGDRFRLIETGSGHALVWSSVWDDAASADRFTEALRAVATRLGRALRVSAGELGGLPAVHAVLGDVGAVEALVTPAACVVADTSIPAC
jgi:hypothetical protein